MKTTGEQNRIQKTRALTLDAETHDKLDQLAKQFAEGSRSRMVRMLIRKEWAIVYAQIPQPWHPLDYSGKSEELGAELGEKRIR